MRTALLLFLAACGCPRDTFEDDGICAPTLHPIVCLAGAYDCASPTSMLECVKSGQAYAAPCRGPSGCHMNGGFSCDLRGSREGEPCAVLASNLVTCTVAGDALLACEGGQWVMSERCRCVDGPKSSACQP